MAIKEELEKQGNWLFKRRGSLPLIILIMGIFFYSRTELNPSSFILEESIYEPYYEFGCLIISMFGFYIRIYTVGHSPHNTSGRNVKEQIADQLNTTGFYSWIRHPLYLGNFFMWLGPALLTGNAWFVIIFILLFWVYYERIIFAEESFLSLKFGETFNRWSSLVPCIIPNFKNFIKPSFPFNWKKVLKKEKDGLISLFIIFEFFDFLGEYLEGRHEYNIVLMVSSGLVIIFYILVRYLKYHTSLLDETVG